MILHLRADRLAKWTTLVPCPRHSDQISEAGGSNPLTPTSDFSRLYRTYTVIEGAIAHVSVSMGPIPAISDFATKSICASNSSVAASCVTSPAC